jgi:acyl carrier protein
MDERNDLIRKVTVIMAEILGCDAAQISPHCSVDELPGWDSVKHLGLIVELEERFSITIPPDLMVEMTTFQNIINILARLEAR